MKVISATVALCSTLLLAACFPPTTTHPIGGPSNRGDSLLLGGWSGTMDESDDKSNKAEFRFSRMSGGALKAVLRSTDPKNKDDGEMVAIVSTAKLGPYSYLNARIIAMGKDKDGSEEKMEGTVPLLYRREGNAVVLYLMDEDAAKKAIADHRIAGKVEPGSFGDASITADQRTLDTFFSTAEGAALFKERFATLVR